MLHSITLNFSGKGRGRGRAWYRGAVFGVSSLPRAFTKLLRPVIAFLRSFGIRLVIFLDDILVASESSFPVNSACESDVPRPHLHRHAENDRRIFRCEEGLQRLPSPGGSRESHPGGNMQPGVSV